MENTTYTVEIWVAREDGSRMIIHTITKIETEGKAQGIARQAIEGKTMHPSVSDNQRMLWDYHCNGHGGRVRCAKVF
jgi:hypothetical protein